MSIVLLRKLTMKSKIGFGINAILCVQELMHMHKHSELIKIYYNCDRIDFDDEVKGALQIVGKRIISKPGKDLTIYKENIWNMIDEITNTEQTFSGDHKHRYAMFYDKKAQKKHDIISNCIRQNKEKSKIRNRNRNQKH